MDEFRRMRRFKQEITESECIDILKKAPRGILAFHGENGYPYAIPLNQLYNEEDGRSNQVCFTAMDEGYRKEGDWALTIRSVVCLGRIETVQDRGRALDICRKLALKFYPTAEAAEEEVAKSGEKANVLVMTIDRMTGKRVHEK